jgi:hypothetical protein
MPLRPIATACVLAGVTLLLYGFRLGHAPLGAAEAIQLQQALTATASPSLFFHVSGETWLQPLGVYATALVHTLGTGDAAGRLVSVVAGAIDVALAFVAVRMITGRDWIAVAGAFLLLITPAHWTYARLGTDAIFPVPFVLAWLIAILHFFRWDSLRSLALAGLALGAGVYAHPTAPLVMAWLWALSLVALIVARRTPIRNFLIFGLAFVAMFVPLAAWFALHPETYPDTFGRWGILKAHIRFPLDGLRAQVNWNTLSNRATLFWGLLDPSFLFFAGRGQAIAPFLLVSAILVPLGVARALTVMDTATRLLLLSAALVPPVIASTFGLGRDLAPAMPMVAALALLAAVGLQSLADRSRTWLWLTVAAAVAAVVQLAGLR